MDVRKRLLTIRMLDAMKVKRELSNRLGLKDVSYYVNADNEKENQRLDLMLQGHKV